MKYILLLLISTMLFSKSIDSCYSVQLKSFKIRNNSSYVYERQGYPRECKLIKFSKMYAVRCGCFDIYNQAEKALEKYAQTYPDVLLVTTYRKRFADMIKTEEPIDNHENGLNDEKWRENSSLVIDSFSESGKFDDVGDAEDLESYGYK